MSFRLEIIDAVSIRCFSIARKFSFQMKNDEIMWDFFLKNARLMLLEEYIPRVEHAVEVCQKQGKYPELLILLFRVILFFFLLDWNCQFRLVYSDSHGGMRGCVASWEMFMGHR